MSPLLQKQVLANKTRVNKNQNQKMVTGLHHIHISVTER